MTRAGAWLRGAGVGATAMYFFDPHVGRRRRALVRDRAVHLVHVLRDEVETEVRDAGNRLRGVVATARRVAAGSRAPDVSDETIASELRARLARLEHPDAIVVEVQDGCVHLRGQALAKDAERARRAVRRVRGARAMVDRLEVHAAPDVPALRGRVRPVPIDPATRLAMGLVGAAAVLPLFRHVRLLPVARLLSLGALASAVYGVEGARRRAVAHVPSGRLAGSAPSAAVEAARA